MLDHKRQRAHRLAWLLMTGKWPTKEIDHKDTNGTNNKWTNLREATHAQNMKNMKKLNINKSGHKGVSWCKQTLRWRATINVDGRFIHLGRFDSLEEASQAYHTAALKYHQQFARCD